MTLTYWIADCLTDAKCYSVRAKTRKECIRQLEECRPDPRERAIDFGTPRKVVVEYADAFDLVSRALEEGGIE